MEYFISQKQLESFPLRSVNHTEKNHTETDIYLSNKNLDQVIITKTTKKQELH